MIDDQKGKERKGKETRGRRAMNFKVSKREGLREMKKGRSEQTKKSKRSPIKWTETNQIGIQIRENGGKKKRKEKKRKEKTPEEKRAN